ncbi:hypothetical protein [Daejeonella oryzae]|uniref:hypothetical protein n=1 Tax=Daejeonella oryzae TaxID=1122943 RepID=UPI0003FD36EA|nr:hypothetical protein [Daejeonella oryzae]
MLFILIFIISLVLQFFLPWWIIAPIAIGMSYWKATSGRNAFTSAFGAIFLLWILMGLLESIPNENLLANRVGQLLMLPQSSFNWIIVLLITGIIGGLAAGFSALSGYYLRLAFIKPSTI